ncbi:MAG TPA: hypothetical protein VGK49_12585 [Ilumatobacteraceae bacterium]
MEDAGFILGAYAITFGAVGFFSWRVLRLGRRLSRRVPDSEKYWA